MSLEQVEILEMVPLARLDAINIYHSFNIVKLFNYLIGVPRMAMASPTT